ncbi:MAG: diguanylate cyclase [Cellvibrionaceae bacterium]
MLASPADLTEANKPVDSNQNIDQIRLWHRNFDAKQTRGLLELALSKTTREYGRYQILRGEELSQRRALASLIQNNTHHLDVINAVVDDQRENSLLPIRVVSDEGLIGYRVCLIRKDEASRFEAIRSHLDITNSGIIFGQGAHWPDTKILRQNALKVVTSVHYESLFSMLLAKRFHCFLRGANEAFDDLERHSDDQLMIEPSLLFSYPSTSTFFVNRSNPELAARIELGIRRAILDGSFSDYFETVYKQDLKTLNLKSRRIIRLNNPYISDEFLEKSTQRYILKSSLKGDFKLQ